MLGRRGVLGTACGKWDWSDLRDKFEPPTKERLNVSNAAIAADWLRSEIGRGELAGVFRREDYLAHTPRMGEEGYQAPEDLGIINTVPLSSLGHSPRHQGVDRDAL